MNLATPLSWDVSLVADGADLSALSALMEAPVSGSVSASGQADGDSWSLRLSELELSSSLLERALLARGELRVDQGLDISGSQLSLELGNARATLAAAPG